MQYTVDKTVLLPIGRIEPIPRDIINLGFTIEEKITVVGMQISNDMGNFQFEVLKIGGKIARITREFAQFNLSLPGRINVAKAYLYSQVNYLGSFLPLDRKQCKFLGDMIAKFVSGKLNISEKRMYGDVDQGGLGMFEMYNFLQSQKCGWYPYLQ